MTALLVILTVVILVAVDAARLYLMRRKEIETRVARPILAFSPANPPRGLFLDGSHTWIRLSDSGEMRVGVDELLSQALGGADRVELPTLGTKVRRGEPMAAIWKNGRKMTVSSPVDGTIVTSNNFLNSMPNDLGADPYGSGWLTTIWPIEHREALKPFTMGEAGKRWMDREIQRLSDFLAARVTGQPGFALAADGAHPAVGAASILEDDGWKEFQREFAAVRET